MHAASAGDGAGRGSRAGDALPPRCGRSCAASPERCERSFLPIARLLLPTLRLLPKFENLRVGAARYKSSFSWQSLDRARARRVCGRSRVCSLDRRGIGPRSSSQLDSQLTRTSRIFPGEISKQGRSRTKCPRYTQPFGDRSARATRLGPVAHQRHARER